ncbi:MlaE family ABC transporter permease [Rhodopila sp.]|uniref:MlaE family ABC transporter permease n=1 Tax=Rhodopila sp. TaxID=2480087 RepID=UPI003D132958
MSMLSVVGAETRKRSSYVLQLASLFWGVIREIAWPSTWRRTLRAVFRTTLTQTVAGSLGTIAVTALIVGLGLVFEAIYWLRTAGQQEQIGRILVVVLFREITPLLVGIILLGRAGTAATAELGMLTADGEIAILRAEGVDIFDFMVLPRAVAFALGSFTLGVMFVLVALISGFVTGSFAGVVNTSIFGFLDNVLRAMTLGDMVIFPAKLLLIGLVVALSSCVTGLGAQEADTPSSLLPRGFTRGVTGILTVSLVLSATI